MYAFQKMQKQNKRRETALKTCFPALIIGFYDICCIADPLRSVPLQNFDVFLSLQRQIMRQRMTQKAHDLQFIQCVKDRVVGLMIPTVSG